MGQYTIKDVQNRAEVLKNDVDNIYRALNDKLGSSPETLDQVPEYILSIPDLPTEEPLTITPTIDRQEFSVGSETKYNPITVEPVTSSIDSNIQPENIKEGVSILGVAGTLSGGDTPDYRYMKGTIDKEGLKAIGWTDEDILTYEQNKTPHYTWQNDQYKVSEENKALYLLDDPDPSSYMNNPNVAFIPKKNMESYFAKLRGFMDMKYIKGIPFYDTSNMTDMGSMFYNCLDLATIPQIDTSNVTDMGYMFHNCSKLTAIPQLNTSKVQYMHNMFNNCTSLTAIPQLDTSSVFSIERMFSECHNLTTIPQLNTSKVNDTNHMFYKCTQLTSIPQLDTSNVTNMNEMFSNCTQLTSIPQLDTSNVTNMYGMFNECSNLRTIPQLNTSNVTNMFEMFYNCKKLESIPRLDTSKVTNMEIMFYGCPNLTTVEGLDFSGFTSKVTNIFGWGANMTNLTRFIVNGKINVSISDEWSIKALTAIDYDSVKSILAAADRTDNTNSKTLTFNRTMTDQNGELAALVASCTSKGWTISGLTLQ